MRKEDWKWAVAYVGLLVVTVLLIVSGGFVWVNNNYPYAAGFTQFVVFASAGELLSIRLLYGRWELNQATAFKGLCWGLGGVVVTLAFRVFSEGTLIAMQAGLLPFYGNALALAFFTSCTNNFMFAPLHSAAMRICGNYAEITFTEKRRITVREAVNSVDWGELVDFTVFKTIPFFWVPVNTLGFLLPGGYRIPFAASLSLVFGVLMTVLKLRESKNRIKEE